MEKVVHHAAFFGRERDPRITCGATFVADGPHKTLQGSEWQWVKFEGYPDRVTCPECLKRKPGTPADEIRVGDRFRNTDGRVFKVVTVTATGGTGWFADSGSACEIAFAREAIALTSVWTRLPREALPFVLDVESPDVDPDRVFIVFKAALAALGPNKYPLVNRDPENNCHADKPGGRGVHTAMTLPAAPPAEKCLPACTPAAPCMVDDLKWKCPAIREERIARDTEDANRHYAAGKRLDAIRAERAVGEKPELRCARDWGCGLVRTK